MGVKEDVSLVFGDLVDVVLFRHVAKGRDLKGQAIADRSWVRVDEELESEGVF